MKVMLGALIARVNSWYFVLFTQFVKNVDVKIIGMFLSYVNSRTNTRLKKWHCVLFIEQSYALFFHFPVDLKT